MKKCVLMVCALAGATAPALASISYSGGSLSENFDTLTPAAAHFSFTAGVQNSIPGLSSWAGAKIAGSGGTNMNFTADTGAGNSGALFSYGAAATPADRALGALASGTNAGAFGVEVINNTLGTLTDITISFDREQYRSSTSTTNVLSFAYGLSGGAITSSNFLSEATMAPWSPGNAVGDTFVATNGVLAPPTVVAVNFTITGLTWLPGQSLFIRWSDFNDVGNDAGIAIDNFGFSAVPTPGALALAGIGGLLAARRRRA